jgi:hypothetical protein
MAKKIDGVVEAARYSPEGKLLMVRMYERRGPVFSDHLLVGRDDLVQRLRSGRRITTGRRQVYRGGTFEHGQPLLLVGQKGKEYITTQGSPTVRDDLQGTPLF